MAHNPYRRTRSGVVYAMNEKEPIIFRIVCFPPPLTVADADLYCDGMNELEQTSWAWKNPPLLEVE